MTLKHTAGTAAIPTASRHALNKKGASKMDKSFIEKRIIERAKSIAEQEYKNFRAFCEKNKIASRLLIGKKRLSTLGSHGNSIFNGRLNGDGEGTNLAEVLEARRTELEKDLTDNLLAKLKDIIYIINNYQPIQDVEPPTL